MQQRFFPRSPNPLILFLWMQPKDSIFIFTGSVATLKSGGLLVSDNILQEGDLIESRFAVERRNRTIYKRMREYLYELKHNDELVTSLLPLGDGVAISTKR